MRADIAFTRSALERIGARPNKALGQNFCIDGERLRACVERMTLADTVIEIGPGFGALTELLLMRGATVTAVEKDETMVRFLTETLTHPRLAVVQGDALKFRYADVPAPFSVVGNLPYYITTPLCAAVLKAQPVSFYAMVQKEAGDRFFAKPKDDNYGPLSIVTQLWYDAAVLDAFSEDCFYPSPNVASVFVGMTARADAPNVPPAKLYAFCSELLSMRRKTIKNNLKAYPDADAALKTLSIDPATRAETLSPETILRLYTLLAD